MQFEEGLATFLGNVSAYWSGNPEPLACDSSMQFLPCSSFNSGTIFLENSDAYAGTVSRHEEDVAKYLRDLYDASNPNPNATNEYRDTTNLNFYHIVDSINDFTSSYGNGGKNEPFSGGNYDDLDGRSARDFQHYVDIVGNISYAQSNSLYWMNGIPAGAY